MVNIDLLKEKIDDSGITIVALARKTGMTRATIHNRLNGSHGEFTASQIMAFSEALHLSRDERDQIFLSEG